MRKLYIKIFLAFALMLSASAMYAIDLPTRMIAGKEYYYYIVKRGDTLYSLQEQLGMTRSEILRFNPTASDGLSAGSILLFPIEEAKTITRSDTHDTPQSHVVGRNETIFGIAHDYGISPEMIVAANPQANNGVRAGMVLTIPSSDQTKESEADSESGVETHVKTESTTPKSETIQKLRPVQSENSITPDETNSSGPENDIDSFSDDISTVDVVIEKSQESTPKEIVIALPLMSTSEALSKQAQGYNEFYKGFLIGLKNVADSCNSRINVNIIDTSVEPTPSLTNSDIIIVGEEETAITAAARKASSKALVLNLFNIHDNSNLSHSNIFQANIAQQAMFDKAIDAVLTDFTGYIPVILEREGSKSEKAAFISALRAAYDEKGVPVIDVNYSGNLSESNLDALAPAGKYLFLSTSGSLSDFNHFAPLLVTMLKGEDNLMDIKVFGYPDWIVFRGDALEKLYTLGASYYSRYNFTDKMPEAVQLQEDFKRWYGTMPTEAVPSQYILGYDTAIYLVNALHNSSFPEEISADSDAFIGIQSAFRPQKINGEASGYANDALFIISCQKDKTISSKVL